jgi:hypothetical protein
MIQKIVSRKVELPPIFLIENEEDFKALPRGLPYIIGNKSELSFITVYLEFQVLLKSALKTNLPLKWLDCLKRIGYNHTSMRQYQLKSGGEYTDGGSGNYNLSIDDFVEDQYFVDFDKLSDLKILPVWLDDLKQAIQTNIIDEVIFDPAAFNKQLGLNVGASTVKHNMKNLLILDISSSMPKSVVITITQLAKLMSKKFYADVMLTGRETYLIDYDDVPNYDIVGSVAKFGGGNEGTMYKEIVKEHKEYNTVISFGDDDSPAGFSGCTIKECNFKCETLYTLHTEKSSDNVTGYAKALEPKTTIKVKNWISSVNK